MRQAIFTLQRSTDDVWFCPIQELLHSPENIYPESVHQTSIEQVRSLDDGTYTMVARFEGERFNLERFLEESESVLSSFIPNDREGLVAFIHGFPTLTTVKLLNLFSANPVYWDGNLVFNADTSITVKLAGECSIIATIVENFPDEVDIRVDKLTSISSPDSSLGSLMTERQLEVVSTAFDLSYYDFPRGVTQHDIANELGLASSTVNEHLRVAERHILAEFLHG